MRGVCYTQDSTLRVSGLLYSGPSLRELSGGNWIILWGPVVATAPETSGLGTSLYVPLLGNYSALIYIWVSPAGLWAGRCQDSYLVDSASSHMLVSKIKPCMSKYKQSIL